MTSSLRTLARALPSLLFLLAAPLAQAAVPQRIAAAINNAQRVTLPGSHPARAIPAHDQGPVAPDLQLHGVEIDFALSPAQQADLTTLLAAQQNPASPLYHQWLTPAAFAARFGMADADLAAVSTWLSSQGFTIEGVSPNKLGITFAGTAAQMQSAFGAELHNYRSPTDTVAHFAPAADLTIPAALAGTVTGVRHLSSFRAKPMLRRGNTGVTPAFTSSQTGNHFLTPGDIATIYNLKAAYSAGYTGTGQTIAVIGQSAIVATDITNFQTAAGVPVKAPTLTLVPNTGASTAYTDDESESDLDLEYASSIATGATVNFVYAGANQNADIFTALNYAVQSQIGQVITLSYGLCESDAQTDGTFATTEITLQQAAAQGQTFVNSSGDTGSMACADDDYTLPTATQLATEQSLNTSYPASSAYAVAVGGTEFPAADTASTNSTYWTSASGSDVIASAISYIPEQAWNDDTASSAGGGNSALYNSLSAAGGGVSILTPRPSWQTGVSGIATGFYRLTPDVSLAASPSYPGYLYCSSDTSVGITGSCSNGFRDVNNVNLTVAGGTSFAAPIFAGMIAIINQHQNATTGQGLITPTLYALASNTATYASAFHDVTSGGNECTVGTAICGTGNQDLYYTATTGYDEATGLGSPNFYNLLTAWGTAGASAAGKSFAITVSPTTLTIVHGSSGTATVTVTPAGGYTGTVAWSISASPALQYACYTLLNATVTGTSAANVTLTIQTSDSNCQAGALRGGTTVSANHPPAIPGQASPAGPAGPAGRIPAGIALAGLLATGCFARRARRLQQLRGLLGMALLAVSGIALSTLTGCSSGTLPASTTTTTTTVTTVNPTVNNTPAGTYTITITGTDTSTATITAKTTLTLTVS